MALLQDPTSSHPRISHPVNPSVWDTDNPSIAQCPPVSIQLRDPTKFIHQPQYPLTTSTLLGLSPIISDLLHKGYLRPTQSPYNTPILGIKKPNGSYRLVQDLRSINAAVIPIHPLVPNPYTLLSLIPASSTHFSVLDLKDAFFSVPLDPSSQDLFAFTWTDPHTRHSEQLTWTVLPQGFRDSPHLFGQTLSHDLKNFYPTCPLSTLLQYVDDLLLCSPSWDISQRDTAALLNFLAQHGYKVTPSKAQISASQVTYLGFLLTPQHKSITTDRKQALSSWPVPKTKAEILSFLGLAGYFRAWIPNFSLLAKPLYDLSKGDPNEPLPSSPKTPFNNLRLKLLSAPALHLPDLTRSFLLYVHENQGQALGVLGQMQGPTFAPVAYLSKQLDPTVRGWAPCLRVLAAAQKLQQETFKLTFGAPLTICSPHHLKDLLAYKSLHTLPPSRVLALITSFLENPSISFQSCSPLNPATLLPVHPTPEPPLHNCLETLQSLTHSPSTIVEGPLPHADHNWFTDGSSYRSPTAPKAGYAIVSLTATIEAQPLPPGTTNQQAELIAATRACILAEGKTLNLYTDSKYVFHTLLSHSAIWKERGFMTTRGNTITNSDLIHKLLQASQLPTRLGIIHCKAHKKDNSPSTQGNRLADAAAKNAAFSKSSETPPPILHLSSPSPIPDKKLLFQMLHDLFHSSPQSLSRFLQSFFPLTSQDREMLKQLSQTCVICQRTNPNTTTVPYPYPSHQARGSIPAADWQVDFTHMPPVRRHRYLLVFLDTFSGWIEAFPTTNKRASTVANHLLTSIIPRFGMPTSLQSDNGPEFTAQVIQSLSQSLALPWHLHCPYRPQASGKVERANRSIKETLTKLSLELHLDWIRLLPLALFKLRLLPKKPTNLSPFEVMYGRSPVPPGIVPTSLNIPNTLSLPLLSHLRAELWKHQDWLLPRPLATSPPPSLNPGDLAYYTPPTTPEPLSPKWLGPYPVILSTPTAAKLILPSNETTPWIHISRLKPCPADQGDSPPTPLDPDPINTGKPNIYTSSVDPSNPLKLRLSRLSPIQEE